ncbi:unnamed protein product [Rodentolepis nana]|uniref:Integrase core domain containing protein n=1 Tax=Rodentolepis nana TaxID=102285 RepID=A0A0R3TDS4_RODNA|nr:unnamed protein product [Rodentolepis nana]
MPTTTTEVPTAYFVEDNEELLHNIPAMHQNDPNMADMMSQLAPQLEHIQDLVLSSPSQSIMESRINCLSRLIGFWQEGKEAMVLVPAKRVILKGNTEIDADKAIRHQEECTSTSYVPHLKESRDGVCLGSYGVHHQDDFYQHATKQENCIS